MNAPPSSLDVNLNSTDVVNMGTTEFSNIDFSATFTEATNGFEMSDIVVPNGNVTNFIGSDGDTVYTFTVIANSVGQVTVRVPAGVAQAAGSGSSNNSSITYSYSFNNVSAEPTDVEILWYLLGEETFDDENLEGADYNDDSSVDVGDIFLAPKG